MVHTYAHTHTYTQRDYGQFLSLGGGILLEIQQFSEKIVHFCVAKSTLHLHVLHDLERDGLERGQAQEKLRESLRGDGVHGFGAVLERLEDLLLEDFHLLLGSGAKAFGICASKQRRKRDGVIKFQTR